MVVERGHRLYELNAIIAGKIHRQKDIQQFKRKMAEFKYQTPKPLGEDTTEYRLVTKDYVEVKECDGRRILKVAPEGLELLAKEAIADVSFYLRPSHLKKLASILDDPEASDNDKYHAAQPGSGRQGPVAYMPGHGNGYSNG